MFSLKFRLLYFVVVYAPYF